MPDLDFSVLEKAIASLGEAIVLSRENPGDEIVRDAVIQRFEYTYELCWKLLKRVLEQEGFSSPAIQVLSYKDLMREGATLGFIDDPVAWFRYREARNLTVHTYDRSNADTVYLTALAFLEDARKLYEKLVRTNND